jgi:choline dehydrogenase
MLEGGRVVGVEYEREGRVSTARAARQVVLAAGAIGTPQIMMLSGLGPAAHLKQHGIEVLRDLPGVGASLQDHLQIRTSFRISGARTLNDTQASLWGKARIAAQYALSRSGPMAMSPSQLGLFTRSHPRYATPNVEFHVQPLSLDAFGEPLHPYPALTVSVCNLRPNSVGSVRLASANFRDAPVIAPNYLSDQEDRDVAVDSIRLARKLMATNRMAGFKPVEEKPGADVQSEEELAEAAGRIATTIFHPVSTARMGRPDDQMAVVDTRLAVRGVAGLMIADASVMPRIVSGNTHAPVVMIAERAAEFLLSGVDRSQDRAGYLSDIGPGSTGDQAATE